MLGTISGILWDLPVFLLLGISMYISLRICLFPDFTIDGSFALGMAGLFFGLELSNDSALIGLSFALLFSGAAGAITGILYAYVLKQEPLYKLLAGLLVMFSVLSLSFRCLGGSSQGLSRKDHFVNLLSNVEANWGLNPWRPITLLVMILAVVTIAYFLFVFLKSPQGIMFRAAGSRPYFFQVFGQSQKKMIILGLIVSNMLVGLSGWMYGVMNKQVVFYSPGMIIDGLGVLLLGEAIYDRWSNNKDISPKHALIACFCGVLLYGFAKGMAAYVLQSALGVHFIPQDHKLIVSLIILFAIWISKKKQTDKIHTQKTTAF